MAVANLPRFLFGLLSKVFKSVPVQATLYFFIFYSYLILFSVPHLILFLYRVILSLVFNFFYHNKIKLDGDAASILAPVDSFANVINITFFIYIDGHCDIEALRKRISTKILAKDENGNRPYKSLLNSSTEKFGYTCLTDKSETIDFKNHVRLCPFADDSDKVYAEQEFLDAVAKLADEMWEESKPKWELLVTPQMRVEGSEKISSGIAVKFHHLYVDGISLAQFIRNCVYDQPCPKLSVDPVNPPYYSPLSFWENVLLGFQIFFMGPYISLHQLWNDNDPVFDEGPLIGGKLFGRSKLTISLEMMRRIRKFHGCSTHAILNSAFVGSFQKMAERKRISLPDKVISGAVFANFPYPDEYPRNNQVFGYQPIEIKGTDPILRLSQINKSMLTLDGRGYAIKSARIFLGLMVLYPAAVLRSSSTLMKMSYYVSNVVGMTEPVKIGGNPVALTYGTGPVCNSVRYHIGVNVFGGTFVAGFLIERSKIIGNREEMEDWIKEFENEIRYMDLKVKQS